jgi:hypothetical protein
MHVTYLLDQPPRFGNISNTSSQSVEGLRKWLYPDLVAQEIEPRPWEWFRQDICKLIFCWDVRYLDVTVELLMSDKMVPDRYMLGSLVEFWILDESGGFLVIT